MEKRINQAKAEAVEWAMAHGVGLKITADTAKHAAFCLSPSFITKDRFHSLRSSVHLLGKLIHAVSEDRDFIVDAISPMKSGDSFFSELLDMYEQIHRTTPKRLPLLIMRSDFMDDELLGPKLVEFNGIAAGMGPFGQRAHELHQFLKTHWPKVYSFWSGGLEGELVENKAIDRLADSITKATLQIKGEFNDEGMPTFVMIIQENEDNVYDQHLLEYALQERGIRTIRRTFRELYDSLSTGENDRLVLKDVGPVDTVYLRAGYQFSDYIATDLVEEACCKSLIQTRMFIEKHRVAVNATVGQQLATSKRVQMLLSSVEAKELTQFGLSLSEALTVKDLLGEMLPINDQSADWIQGRPLDEWVLKNQGEGGGHCVFGEDIHKKLNEIPNSEYQSWSLMRRLHPAKKEKRTYVMRSGDMSVVDDLICEMGMFTVHIDGVAALDSGAYVGYLIRSKSSLVTEGGVHSGMGALDSLAFKE